MNKILERITRETGVPDLVSILAERLTPTDLQSLMLEVYRQRSSRRSPAKLLESYESDRFVRPSAISARRLLAWELIVMESLPDEFEPLALSPLAPLGACSVVAPVDQNWSVATARNTEVVSNSTNVLALECALHRRALLRENPKSISGVHLAASQRLLRAQHYQDAGSVTHFSAFVLCSAGRDLGSLRFELEALSLHIRFYLKALRRFLSEAIPLHVSVTEFGNIDRLSRLETELLAPISSNHPGVDCKFDLQREQGKGYYQELCFHIHASHPDGRRLELADGGCVDWTQRLLSNAKEKCVISGIGSERVCTTFGN